MEQPLHSWMTDVEFEEFSNFKISRLLTFTGIVEQALNNALIGAESFFHPDPDYPERREDDDAFPGDEITQVFLEFRETYPDTALWQLPDPLPSVFVDTSIRCATGDEVPMTGVWYPSVGLEQHSLTFAIKGRPMQAAYRVTKTIEELEAEEVLLPVAETVAVPTIWHPVRTVEQAPETEEVLWAKSGERCPRAGLWKPTDPGATPRIYETGDVMMQLDSSHGLTIWQWVENR